MINLTIQSLNNKTIKAINLSNNSIATTFNQSDVVNLDYTNFYIKIQSADTFTMGNLGHIVRQPLNDPIFIFIAFLLIACALTIAFIFRRKR